MRTALKKLLTFPMLFIGALLLFFEEWLWDRLSHFMARLARAPVIRAVESRIAALPPYWAMAVFLLPHLFTFPLGLFGLWLVAHGRPAAGTSVLVADKILGVAILARLFTLCRPTLLTVPWFRHLCEWLERLKQRLYSSPPWQAVVRWKNHLAAFLHRLTRSVRALRFRRRRRAAKRWLHRRFFGPRSASAHSTATPPQPSSAESGAPGSSQPEVIPSSPPPDATRGL